MLEETFIEMERGAKALDLHDVHTAAVCLRKALEGHVAMAPPGPTPPPQAQGPLAELAKAINALETSEFGVASLCSEKAAIALEGRLPAEVTSALTSASRSIRTQDFGTTATQLRAIIRYYEPEATLPPPAEAPNVIILDNDEITPLQASPEVAERLEEAVITPRF